MVVLLLLFSLLEFIIYFPLQGALQDTFEKVVRKGVVKKRLILREGEHWNYYI